MGFQCVQYAISTSSDTTYQERLEGWEEAWETSKGQINVAYSKKFKRYKGKYNPLWNSNIQKNSSNTLDLSAEPNCLIQTKATKLESVG